MHWYKIIFLSDNKKQIFEIYWVLNKFTEMGDGLTQNVTKINYFCYLNVKIAYINVLILWAHGRNNKYNDTVFGELNIQIKIIAIL